jgi:hypothetical protein
MANRPSGDTRGSTSVPRGSTIVRTTLPARSIQARPAGLGFEASGEHHQRSIAGNRRHAGISEHNERLSGRLLSAH